MRARHICTSCSEVSDPASKAAFRSATVAESSEIGLRTLSEGGRANCADQNEYWEECEFIHRCRHWIGLIAAGYWIVSVP